MSYPDMSPEAMLELWYTGTGYERDRNRRQVVNCDMFGWEYAEEDDFEQDVKYQNATHVIQHELTGRCFMVFVSRSGSPFTDWEYYYTDDPVEVRAEKKVITVTDWVKV